jgi:protein disulfide-isomerase
MKKLVLSLVASLAFLHVSAAEVEWLTDFTKAQEKAKAENKKILLDFTGSDWCPPCIALHKNVLNTKEFAEFAKDNLVLVELDFPRRTKLPAQQKEANDKLLKKFEVDAFPTIIVLDTTGKELKRNRGYDGSSAKDYIAQLQAVVKKQGG